MSAEGLLAGATRAIMPEQRVDTVLAANCRMAFRVFMVGLFVVSAFGMARVTLSAQAAATSVAAMRMKTELRAARQQSESLELDRGTLARASRIESAAAGLQMGRPANVRYISLPKALAVPAAGATAAAKTTSMRVPDSLKGMVDAAARITANEAQVLLASGSGLGVGR
jgi:cell division protein FtsL